MHRLVREYLERALEEYETNPLATQLIRRLADEVPGDFLESAIEYLKSTNEVSPALRYLTVVTLRQEQTIDRLTDPILSSRETSVQLFNRFLQIDPSFDVRLASRLPDRRGSAFPDALDTMHSLRGLDILDQTSYGRRLLPVIGHLANHHDAKISAKTILFVGRRVQNSAWTKKQLSQPDPRVRANAIEALWGVHSPAAESILQECVSDRNNRVAGNSLLGLHLLGRPGVKQGVLDMAKERKHEKRLTAAWLMGKFAGQETIDRLGVLVKDKHPMVRFRALRSLIDIRRFESQSPEAIAARAARKDAEKVLEAAASVLGERTADNPIDLRLDGSAFIVRKKSR